MEELKRDLLACQAELNAVRKVQSAGTALATGAVMESGDKEHKKQDPKM